MSFFSTDMRVRLFSRVLTPGSFFFAPVIYFLIWRKRKNLSVKKHPDRFFIVPQLTRIGDIICVTPVFHTIKKTYPKSYIAVLVSKKAAGILAHNPYIDELIVLEKYKSNLFSLVRKIRKEDFDVSFSFSGTSFTSLLFFWGLIPTRIKLTRNPRPPTERFTDWQNTFEEEYSHHTFAPRFYLSMLQYVGIRKVYPEKQVYTSVEADVEVRKFLCGEGVSEIDTVIGVSITAGNKIKEWGDERFGEVALRLAEKYHAKIIWIGGAWDRERIENLVYKLGNPAGHCIATHFSLEELSSLIKILSLYIAVDTGPIYVAHALGIPLVDITGPVDPWEQPPHDDRSICVTPPAPFYPSSFVFKTRGEDEDTKEALDAITVDEVVCAADYLLKKEKM